MTPINILHLHSSFDHGGKEARAVRLMNAFGDRARHVIVSGVPGRYGAAAAIAAGIDYQLAQDPPALVGAPSVTRYEAIARLMRRFDLVLSYNWGAIDGVMARRVFSRAMPPIVHHEDGFNADEATDLKHERNIYRRLALSAAFALVVPSQTLERVALRRWRQPRARVHRIVNGVPVERFNLPAPDAIPGFRRKSGEVVIGTMAGMRPVKNLPMLVRAVGGVSARIRLVIVGDGPDRAAIAAAAEAMDLTSRLHLPGYLPDPSRYVGLFDILALSSLSEQFPISVVEAMAAGLPVAATDVGDIATMVSSANAPYITGRRTEVDLRDLLQLFAADAVARKQLGSLNRQRAEADYDEAIMIARYAALYEAAIGRPGALIERTV